MYNQIPLLSAARDVWFWAENRKPGVNPGRYRRCNARDALPSVKAGHWGDLRRQSGAGGLELSGARKSEDLLRGAMCPSPRVGAELAQPNWNAEKGRGGPSWAAAAFLFSGGPGGWPKMCGRRAAGKDDAFMRKRKERLLSMLLALVMVMGLLPGTAWAGETQTGNVTFSVETRTIDGAYLVEPMEEELYQGDTVYTILSRVAQEKNLTVVGADTGYVTKIQGFGSYLDSDYGVESGWMAAVNNDRDTWPLPALKDGDSVRFCYTYKTYGHDIDLMDQVEKLEKLVIQASGYTGENEQAVYAAMEAGAEKLAEVQGHGRPKDYIDSLGTMVYGPGSEMEQLKTLNTKLEYALNGEAYIPATGAAISIANSPAHIHEGKEYQLLAAVAPENATVQQGSWAVLEATGEASISQDGILRASKAGMVVVQFWHPDASNGVLATKLITVEEAPPEQPEVGALLEGISAGYRDTYSNSKVIIDMAAYQDYNPGTAHGTTPEARQSYINFALTELTKDGVGETTYSMAILGLQGIGVDPQKLYPVNSNTAVSAVEGLKRAAHSVSAWTTPYTLAAYNQGAYGTDAQEADLVSQVLQSQGEDGSWTEYGESIQTTANMVMGLTFYSGRNPQAKSSVEEAVNYLSTQQKGDGTFDAYGSGADADTCAMVVAALAAAGVNPDTDPKFVKNGNSALDGLLAFALADNSGFGYQNNTEWSGYATEDGFRALIAASQVMATGKAFNIYDFSQNTVAPGRATGEGGVEKPGVPDTNEHISVYFTLKSDVDYWIPRTKVTVKKGSTVYHAFTTALDEAGISYTGAESGYVHSITKGNKTLAEFDKGENSGWLYKVNGKVPGVGLTSCAIENGDNILWYYTEDWTLDPDAGGYRKPQEEQAKVTGNKDGTYTVTMPADRDGPVLVTIPDVGAGQVVVIVRKDGTQTVVKKSLIQNGNAYLLLSQDAAVKVVDYVSGFNDVDAGAWYASAVDFAASRGLFSGVGEDAFGPDMPLNRGMLVTVLYTLEEPDSRAAGTEFSDVEDKSWYAQGTAWAVDTGIVSGYGNGSFGPEDPVTREQLALMLYQYARSVGMNTGGGRSLASFRDGGTASPWAEEALSWAVRYGILSGRADGSLDPGGWATRAEAAAMLRQLVSLMLK